MALDNNINYDALNEEFGELSSGLFFVD